METIPAEILVQIFKFAQNRLTIALTCRYWRTLLPMLGKYISHQKYLNKFAKLGADIHALLWAKADYADIYQAIAIKGNIDELNILEKLGFRPTKNSIEGASKSSNMKVVSWFRSRGYEHTNESYMHAFRHGLNIDYSGIRWILKTIGEMPLEKINWSIVLQVADYAGLYSCVFKAIGKHGSISIMELMLKKLGPGGDTFITPGDAISAALKGAIKFKHEDFILQYINQIDEFYLPVIQCKIPLLSESCINTIIKNDKLLPHIIVGMLDSGNIEMFNKYYNHSMKLPSIISENYEALKLAEKLGLKHTTTSSKYWNAGTIKWLQERGWKPDTDCYKELLDYDKFDLIKLLNPPKNTFAKFYPNLQTVEFLRQNNYYEFTVCDLVKIINEGDQELIKWVYEYFSHMLPKIGIRVEFSMDNASIRTILQQSTYQYNGSFSAFSI